MKLTIMIKKRKNSEAGAVPIKMADFNEDSVAGMGQILLKDCGRTNPDPTNMKPASKSPGRSDALQFQSGMPLKPIHNRFQMPPPTLFSAPTRAYFRSLRAAELAAWESSGGDYLRSCVVTQA